MIHSFDSRIAEKVGVNSAIILNNLYFWVEKNKANDCNFHDGYYWTYNSQKAFSELFPYFTQKQIRYAIKKLIDMEIIITGNYNELSYDRTLWYAITEKGYELLLGKASCASPEAICQNCQMDSPIATEAICQNCQMEMTELSNRSDKIVKPIPDIKPDIKPDIIYDENFEKLWKMLPPRPGDRKDKVSKERKKELYDMGVDKIQKTIETYLQKIDPKYQYNRDNFFNYAIEYYLYCPDTGNIGDYCSPTSYDIDEFEKLKFEIF